MIYGMASEGKIQLGSTSSALLSLPREIRDLICNELLVQATGIQINCGVVSVPSLEKRGNDHLPTWFPLRRPAHSRSTWRLPLADLSPGAEFGLHLRSEDSIHEKYQVHMTYQLAEPIETTSLDLQILLTCRQLYEEGREIFYSRNTFHFSDSFRIPTALYFLLGRPAQSRAHIHSLEIELTEQNQSNIQSAPNELIAFARRPQTISQLTYSYDFFERLCKLLASSTIQLRYLGIRLESFHDSWLSEQPLTTVAGCLHSEKTVDGSLQHPSLGQPLWLQPLLQITNLHRIDFLCKSEFSQIRRVANVVKRMQENMLTAGEQSTRAVEETTKKKVVDLSLRLCYSPDESILHTEYQDGTDFSVRYDISNDYVEWDSCTFNEVGFGLCKIGEGSAWSRKNTDADANTIQQLIGCELKSY